MNTSSTTTTTATAKMKTHWVADMYPLNESDIEPLAESIKNNGQRTPIMALKDGTIIDGRNRWLACERAGVKPIITVINPDGAEVPDETLWAIATDCNSMRRDMNPSLRACAAAESWKRLWPDGKTNKKDGSQKVGNQSAFAKFAKDSFKVNSAYAEQALAILNSCPDLMEYAKQALANTYKIHLDRQKSNEISRQKSEVASQYPAMMELINSGRISIGEAYAAIQSHRKGTTA